MIFSFISPLHIYFTSFVFCYLLSYLLSHLFVYFATFMFTLPLSLVLFCLHIHSFAIALTLPSSKLCPILLSSVFRPNVLDADSLHTSAIFKQLGVFF